MVGIGEMRGLSKMCDRGWYTGLMGITCVGWCLIVRTGMREGKGDHVVCKLTIILRLLLNEILNPVKSSLD